MVCRLLLLSLFLMGLTSVLVYGQAANVDSLEQALGEATDTTRINLLNELAEHHRNADMEAMERYAQEALTLSEDLDYTRGRAYALWFLGFNQYIGGASLDANDLLEQSRGAFDELGDNLRQADQITQVGVTVILGGSLANLSLMTEALAYQLEAVELSEALGIPQYQSSTLRAVGFTYLRLEDHEKALEYFHAALALIEEDAPTVTLTRTYLQIGTTYGQMERYDEAFAAYQRALAVADTLESEYDRGEALYMMGLHHRRKNEPLEALPYLQQSLTIAERMGYELRISQCLSEMSMVYFQLGNLSRARELGLQSYEAVKDLNLAAIHQTLRDLHPILEATGDYQTALEYRKLHMTVRDSLNAANNNRDIGRIEAQYAFEKQQALQEQQRQEQQRLAQAKRQRTTTILLSGLGLLLLTVIGGTLYIRTLGQKNHLITEQKQELEHTLHELESTQAQLIQSEKLASLGQLTAGIAHEINNPVNFAHAGVMSLERNYEDLLAVLHRYEQLQSGSDVEETLSAIEEAKQAHYYDQIVESMPQLIADIKLGTQRTSEIIKGLQHFSRTDEGKRSKVDLNEAIETTLLLLKNRLGEGIEVEKALDASLPEVACHASQINQVLLNVLANALDAIGEAGKITITTEALPDAVAVRIADTGVGMSEEVRSKVFDPFYTTKEVGSGTGLGLSISYGIVREHGGSIEVESEMGKGSVFRITLPLNPSLTQEDDAALAVTS